MPLLVDGDGDGETGAWLFTDARGRCSWGIVDGIVTLIMGF